ncbi:OmpA family protein [Algirhabdus cladophorae]|uniref:OmpA family protein n=1 Tax=Algirhabdus cladophorae TaxID=3377108 RepID=UPI003B847C06
MTLHEPKKRSWSAPIAAMVPFALVLGVAAYLDPDRTKAFFGLDEQEVAVATPQVEPQRVNNLNNLVENALVVEPQPQLQGDQIAAAIVAAKPAQTEDVTRNEPLGVLQTAPVETALSEPAKPVETLDTAEAATFFSNAQARLAAEESCGNDLAALASQTQIYFPSGGLSAEASGLIKARLIGQVAQSCPGFTVQVEGHSDPSGDSRINQRLSEQRAQSVISLLSTAGIETTNFVAVGFGDQQPSNITGPKGRAYYDRRVEFSIIRDVKTASLNSGGQFWRPAASTCAKQLETKVAQTNLFYAPRAITVSISELESVYQLAAEAANCEGARLRLVGQHSDDQGLREDYNTGRLRALALMGSLVAAGFEGEKILIGAPSKSVDVAGQPSLPNSRVDFQIIMD